MKVVLIQHVQNIGRKGEAKEVKDGFAVNFLLPQKLAVPATEKNIALYSKLMEKEQVAKVTRQENPKKLAKSLSSTILTFTEKADENGTFFAGITKDKIAKELKQYNIKSKQVKLDQAIKKEGEYKVQIDVAPSVTSGIKVIAKQEK